MYHTTLDLDALVALARDAAALLVDHYQGVAPCVTSHKHDASPVTTADLAANQLIVRRLHAKWPGIPVLSEELIEQPTGSDVFWCVDPLDGTRGFIEHNDEFTINIALIEHGSPTVGLVWVPTRDQAYLATRDGGAWLLAPGKDKVPLRSRVWPDSGAVQLVSRHHHQPGEFSDIARAQPMGSALKACVIAQGQADLYWREGPTSWWDTAAFQCVLEVAGGGVFDTQGRPLTYRWDQSLCNPSFLVLGDCQRKRQCLQCIKE